RRRGHPREDGLRLAATSDRDRPGTPGTCTRVPAHRRRDLQPRRLPGRGRREPDSARARLPSPRGIHRRRERFARRARARVDRAGAGDGRGRVGRAPRVGSGFVTAITVTPNPFTLVPYDVREITALLAEAA